MPDEIAAVQPQSPNGTLAGLSALYNRLPPQVQDGIASLVGICGVLVLVSAAGVALPAVVLKWALVGTGVGSALGIISGGTRK